MYSYLGNCICAERTVCDLDKDGITIFKFLPSYVHEYVIVCMIYLSGCMTFKNCNILFYVCMVTVYSTREFTDNIHEKVHNMNDSDASKTLQELLYSSQHLKCTRYST
jgi:hypothetical protein